MKFKTQPLGLVRLLLVIGVINLLPLVTVASIADDLMNVLGDYKCESTCYEIGEDDTDETDISNVNPAWFEECVRVNGTLNIDENTNIWYGTFFMEPGSQIVVESGVTAVFVYSRFQSCDDLWRGITVESGGRLLVYYDMIEDANTAIFMENRASITAYYTVFENNYIGIASALPTDVTSTHKELNGLVVGCDFVNSAALLDPYAGHEYYPSWGSFPQNIGYAAVYLRRSAGLNVGIYSPSASSRNSIDGLRNGIVLDTSIAEIQYCTITQLEGTVLDETYSYPYDIEFLAGTGVYGKSSVVNIHDNTIVRHHDGVTLVESSGIVNDNTIEPSTALIITNRAVTRGIHLVNILDRLMVRDNDISQANIGVSLNGGFTSNITIRDNTITSDSDQPNPIGISVDVWKALGLTGRVSHNTITLEDVATGTGIKLNLVNAIYVDSNTVTYVRTNMNDADYSSGIWIAQSANCIARKNYVYGEDGFATDDHFGVYYENSPFNVLFCNQMFGMEKGFFGVGHCDASKVVANYFAISNTNGFELMAPCRLGIQEHTGNEWGGSTYSNYGAYMSGPMADLTTTAILSEFIIDNDNSCGNWPCPIGPSPIAAQWFSNLSGTAPSCTASPNPNPTVFIASDYVDRILHPGSFNNYNDQFEWMTKSMVYNRILQNAGLLANTQLDSFFDAEETNPLGVLTTAELELHQLYSSSDDMGVLSGNILDSLVILGWIDQELFEQSPDSNALRLRRDDLVETLLDSFEIREGYNEDWRDEYDTSMSSIETALSSLSTSTDFEEYQRRALLYELEVGIDGLNSLSSGDWDEVQEIASLCAWEGGFASMLSQGLCLFGRDSIVPPGLVCTGVEPRSASPILQSKSQVIVFPNPSSVDWNVEIPEDFSKITLVDVKGQVVMSKEVFSRNVTISTTTLASGVYFLQVTSLTGEVIGIKKLVLQE